MKQAIRIHSQDTVAVALEMLEPGVSVYGVTTLEQIPAGHKIALKDMCVGENIIKYGAPIGHATQAIRAGEWVHTHNVKTNLAGECEYQYEPIQNFPNVQTNPNDQFMGYLRTNGSVGVRNEIWIIPTVGCVNSVAQALAKIGNQIKGAQVDAVVAFPHPYGCSQMGEDQENTRKILADLIRHPNAGGVLVLGLGCENCGIETIKPYIGSYDEHRVKFLVVQECEDELEIGRKILTELIRYAAAFERQSIPIDRLIVGLKCGASDGFSGITANPVIGKFSDLLIARGGTTILSEVPEMFGAETILMNRCKGKPEFDKMVTMINRFKQYYTAYHQPIYENPSPGNKKGGITTLEDKSLGCTQKSGSVPVCGILEYGEVVAETGLHLLNAPGNDIVSTTALVASGAQIVLFATGRGTPFGSPVPTIKIASNQTLANHKRNWIDFDAGVVVQDDVPIAVLAENLYEYVKEVASGRWVRSEELGFHDMAIFKTGVTL